MQQKRRVVLVLPCKNIYVPVGVLSLSNECVCLCSTTKVAEVDLSWRKLLFGYSVSLLLYGEFVFCVTTAVCSRVTFLTFHATSVCGAFVSTCDKLCQFIFV